MALYYHWFPFWISFNKSRNSFKSWTWGQLPRRLFEETEHAELDRPGSTVMALLWTSFFLKRIRFKQNGSVARSVLPFCRIRLLDVVDMFQLCKLDVSSMMFFFFFFWGGGI